MTNPLLAKTKLPGRIFQFPSKGLFYDKDVFSEHVHNAEIEVQPLSALAELKLRSPDMLFSGRALREVCLECAPDILKPEQLISKDIDALFCFLRIVTYGAEMTIKSIHECPNHKIHEYVVNIETITMNSNNKILDNIDTLYEMQLSNEQKIKLMPVRYYDSIEMTHLQQEIEKKFAESGNADPILLEKAVVRDLMSVIKSVDNIEDRAMIEEWVKILPRIYFKEIVAYAKKTNEWGFNLTTQLTCKDCGATYPHNLELDPINFFSG